MASERTRPLIQPWTQTLRGPSFSSQLWRSVGGAGPAQTVPLAHRTHSALSGGEGLSGRIIIRTDHRPSTTPLPAPQHLCRGGLQKHKLGINEVLEGGREAEVLITYVKVSFVREEQLSYPLWTMALLGRVNISGFPLFDIQPATGNCIQVLQEITYTMGALQKNGTIKQASAWLLYHVKGRGLGWLFLCNPATRWRSSDVCPSHMSQYTQQ